MDEAIRQRRAPLLESQADTVGDFVTAQAVAPMHRPYTDSKGVERCASATHALSPYGPRWPCGRSRSAQRVIEAHDRAEAQQASTGPRGTS